MRVGTEGGVMQAEAKGHSEPLKAGRGRREYFPRDSERSGPG